MTETQWLQARAPGKLLDFIWGTATERKLLLAACACCRRHWDQLTDPRSRRAVELAESFADGLIDREALSAALPPTQAACLEITEMKEGRVTERRARVRIAQSAVHLLRAALGPHKELVELAMFVRHEGLSRVQQQELRAFECATLRHVFGNPFRAAYSSSGWPSTVTALARAAYEGQPCHFALHDALLDAGHSELAEHFQEVHHPKGCWVLDQILNQR